VEPVLNGCGHGCVSRGRWIVDCGVVQSFVMGSEDACVKKGPQETQKICGSTPLV